MSGTFTVEVDGKTIWNRKSEETKGFPEVKDLKQRVRDVVDPERNLGHSENKVIEISDSDS
jgi:selenoprotein W-related protein